MGYRSQVKIAFVFKDELVRDTFFIAAMEQAKEKAVNDVNWFEESFTHCTLNGNPVTLFEADDIKWYSDYSSVRFIEDEMRDECVKRGGGWAFIRVGEESDDIEQDSNHHDNFDDFSAWDYLYTSTEIHINS